MSAHQSASRRSRRSRMSQATSVALRPVAKACARNRTKASAGSTSPPAPDVPAVVLTSDHQFDFGAGGPETWPAWLRAQDQLARLLGARHITDTNSGHFIQGEQPQLVIDAIREIVDAARN
jgi:pimeloyl-ACP methyl ester carboxylesterase